MRFTRLLNTFCTLCAILLMAGCASEQPCPPGPGEYTRLVLSVDLGQGHRAKPAAGFDNFDNEDDKWGAPGENMEQLRIIILDQAGNVEHNNLYTTGSDAVQAGQYEFQVKRNDTKTVIFLANEKDYLLDEEGMEIAGGTRSLTRYMEQFPVNSWMDTDAVRRLTIALRQNSPDGKGQSLRTPLPISAIYTEHIGNEDVTERSYNLHRAAVKYSFRIINNSNTKHTLSGLRIDRIADREFLFPDARYETNAQGCQVVKEYNVPATSKEGEYEITGLSLQLPAHMPQAVQAVAPVYVPEGSPGNEQAQRVSISLDGVPLQIWKDLKWHMPGEDEASARPMADLPRNSHVVVNITVNDHGIDFIADVQPYAEIIVRPPFGLDRDDEGNIIIERYPDGTYDVVIDNNRVRKDADDDEVLKIFKDGTLLCMTEVLKDYIHDDGEVDYQYFFEKDASGGNMDIIRQTTTGGQYHGGKDDLVVADHEHDTNDRPLFVLDKKGDFYKVYYDTADGVPELSPTDDDGAEIIQANGFQFRDVLDMHRYLGTYVVVKDGNEELRYYKDGSVLDWETGVPETGTRSTSRATDKNKIRKILNSMRRGSLQPLRVLNKHK